MLEKEDSIQVINLMGECAGEQTFTLHLERLALNVLSANRHIGGPQDVPAKSRQRQAPFLFPLVAFDVDDLRVRQHKSCLGIFSHADVNDGEPPRQSDLWRG